MLDLIQIIKTRNLLLSLLTLTLTLTIAKLDLTLTLTMAILKSVFPLHCDIYARVEIRLILTMPAVNVK